MVNTGVVIGKEAAVEMNQPPFHVRIESQRH